MIDCHLHLQDDRLYPHADSIVARLREVGVSRLVVNGTEPIDWEKVAELSERFPEVIPFFGLHPWKVESADNEWEDRLRYFLERCPASGVGEIGLDKWIRGHNIQKQRDAFVRQLELARELDRPVTVHCLQAWGQLLECIQRSAAQEGRVDDLPLSGYLLLHSYGGPAEMIEHFLKAGAYFSISGYFFREDKAGKLKVFEQIPDDRLLIETDAPDMLPPSSWALEYCGNDSDANHPANIAAIYQAVACWKGIESEELESRVEANFVTWFSRGNQTDSVCETASDKSESE